MAVACASYNPSELDIQRFWDQETDRRTPSLEVPEGFPKKLVSTLAWEGKNIEFEQSNWQLDLTAEEVTAINAALASFEAKHEDLSELSISTFQLPNDFSQRLRNISNQLYSGVGFQIIRGLDPDKYTPKQKLIVYAGVTAHVCPQRGFIDVIANGVVAHVTDVQAGGQGPKSIAPAYSNVPLSFHTDNCEIMAFYYLETAQSGGETVLSSIWQTYNELAAKRPDVLHTLSAPWVLETFKSHDLQPPRRVRLLQKLNSSKAPILLRFSRYPITGFQRRRSPDVPNPTQAQFEAADAIQFIAAKNQIKLPIRKGDMLLVNDMAVFHGREAFKDGNNAGKRHLVKMYFRDPDQGWNIPSSIEKDWKTVYSPNQPDGTRKETWHIVHQPGLEELVMLNG